MRLKFCCLASFALLAGNVFGGASYSVEQAVALAMKQNPEIAIARKQVEAARGGVMTARSGYLPSVVASGLLRKRERQEESRLRTDDYNASGRVIQNIYTGGAVSAQVAIAELNQQKRELELRAIEARVAMDVRLAFYDLLLNRAKVGVHRQSAGVLRQELQSQRERLAAGTAGQLNVSRAEVAVANEQPELIDAETRLHNSRVQIATLLALNTKRSSTQIEPAGDLRYTGYRPDLNECLAFADVERPEIRSRQIDIAIEQQQLRLAQSETRPHVDAFTGYEVYSELDPLVGREFNHGYVVGLNANWAVFDGFATRGRIQSAKARIEAATHALEATRLSVASDVRSAFLDLQQADRVLESETRSVANADESLEIAKSNLAAGLGTQLDVLQAAADVTRTRTTRLSAIYLHNVALARLARATGRDPQTLGFASKLKKQREEQQRAAAADVATPPAGLTRNADAH